MRYRIYIPQLDRLVGKKTKCPFGISLGRFPTSQSDNMSLDLSRNFGFYRGRFPFLPQKSCFESLLSIAGSHILHCRSGCVERYSGFLDGHGFLSILVHGKKDIRPEDGSCWRASRLYNLGQLLAIRCRQTHLILLYRHNRIVLCLMTQQRYNYF